MRQMKTNIRSLLVGSALVLGLATSGAQPPAVQPPILSKDRQIVWLTQSKEFQDFRKDLIKKGEMDLRFDAKSASKSLKADLNQKGSNTNSREGGVSDGGGNAVGAVFFDFYENQGTYEIKPEQILRWNELLNRKIKRASQLVPMLNYAGAPGWGHNLESAINSRKWILETKEITKESCRNDSMVQALGQRIVGCQNFFEVRLSAKWLLYEANEENQAGLITHEAILIWARDSFKEMSKSDLEFSVRESNRILFDETIDSEGAQASMRRLFPTRMFFNTNESKAYKVDLPMMKAAVKYNLCHNNSSDDYAQVMNMFSTYPNLYKEINEAFRTYLDFVRWTARMDAKRKAGTGSIVDQEKLDELRGRICSENISKLPDLSHIEFKPNLLSNSCRENVEEAFDHYVSVTDKIKHGVFQGDDGANLKDMVNSTAQSAALFCAGMKGIEIQKGSSRFFMSESTAKDLMREVELQALKYYLILVDTYETKR